MIILLNFGPMAPTHQQLDDLAESTGSALWEHAMFGFRGEPVERLASRVSALVYDAVINYFSSNPYFVDPKYELEEYGVHIDSRWLGHSVNE